VEEEDESIKIADCRQAEWGKSSLLKQIGRMKNGVIRQPNCSTTRDSIDSKIEFGGLEVTLIDTPEFAAGVGSNMAWSIQCIAAFKSIERADVALLMIRCDHRPLPLRIRTLRVSSLMNGKSCVVLVNKWMQSKKNNETMEE